MRLINYGAGEIADRLTILALKLQVGAAAGRPTDHFRHEQAALLTKLKAANGVGSYVEELLELATVNGRLWDAEDEIRAYRVVPWTEAPHGQIAACAFRIQALNDRRAALIEAINTQTGEHRGPEKLTKGASDGPA